jgi:lysine 6-dehydrogenase
MPEYRYGIVGAGRQGTAAAYDLIVRGEAASVVLADIDLALARKAAERVNRLTKSERTSAARVDAADRRSLVEFLSPLDAFLSSASYRLNLGVSAAALEAGTHMCDLGGNLAIVRRQLELDARARSRAVCIVPDCGEAPGLASNLMAYGLTLLDRADELLLYDGGLPARPVPPWNYVLTFNIDGLTNEYDGTTTWRVDGELVEVDCLDPSEDELVAFEPPLGTLEAFAAATSSTTPWTLGERVRTLKAKVLRYPGHAAQFRAFRDLGLFSEEPIDVGGTKVIPRDLFHAWLEPKIRARSGDRDVVVARVVTRGDNEGRPAEAVVELRVQHDEELGFTAMEQATGWHAAIVCHLMASGQIPPGARPVELAVDPLVMLAELRARGCQVSATVEPADRIRNPG